MKVSTYWFDDCEGALYATGETTTISNDVASNVISKLVTCLMGECGRYEGPDYQGALNELIEAGVVDTEFEPTFEDE